MKIRNSRLWAGRGAKRWLIAILAFLMVGFALDMFPSARSPSLLGLTCSITSVLVAYFLGLAPALTGLFFGGAGATYLALIHDAPSQVDLSFDTRVIFIQIIWAGSTAMIIEGYRRERFNRQLISMVAQSRYETLKQLLSRKTTFALRSESEKFRHDRFRSCPRLWSHRNAARSGQIDLETSARISSFEQTCFGSVERRQKLPSSQNLLRPAGVGGRGHRESHAPRHAILLLHGLSSSPLEFRRLTRELERAGFVVRVPTIDGYSAQQPEKPMEAWVRSALTVYDELARNSDYVSVLGMSIGTALAICVAKARPATHSIILLSPTFEFDGWAVPWYRFVFEIAYFSPLRHVVRYRESSPFGLRNEALRARIALLMRSKAISSVGPSTLALSALYQSKRLVRRARVSMKHVKADALIIQSADDETASPINGDEAIKHLCSKRIRAVWLGDSYHMITLDNERDIVAHEVIAFISADNQVTVA